MEASLEEGRNPVLRASTAAYRLLAPAGADVEAAMEGVERALDRFARDVGTVATRPTIILFDSPDDLARFDFDGMPGLERPFLPWLTEAGLRLAVADRIRMVLGVGLVLVREGQRVVIRGLLPTGEPFTPELDEADQILELNGQTIRTLRDWDQAFDRLPPEAELRLRVRRDDDEWVSVGRKLEDTGGVEIRMDTAEPARRASQLVLPHELCHVLLIAWLTERLGEPARLPEGTRAYGDPRVPDWVDEAVAIRCEDPEFREGRLAGLAEQAARVPELAELLARRNPAADHRAARESAGEGRAVVTVELGETAGEDAFPYYAAVSALGDYLAAAGPGALGRIAAAIAEGVDPLEAFGSVGLPSTLAELETDWREWVAQRLGTPR